MPITLPSSISAMIGQSSDQDALLLAEIHFASSTKYFSSGTAVNWAGKSFEGNRIKPSTVTTGILDHSNNNFGSTSLTICNLADDGTASFPIQQLDAAAPLQDRLCILYLYAPDASDGVEIWRGYTGAPKYNGETKTVDIGLKFLFDTLNIPVPAVTLPEAGFGTLSDNKNTAANTTDPVPLAYFVGTKRFRATLYRSEVAGDLLYTDFVISGTAPGHPFNTDTGTGPSGDLITATLFGQVSPVYIAFRSDEVGGVAPHNITMFPDHSLHPHAAYAFAAYKVADAGKTNLNNLQSDSVKVVMSNGRPLADTGLPSENFVYIIRDILEDPNYGLGMPLSDFGDISDAANYTAGRYQARVILTKATPLLTTIQALLGEAHLLMTWTNGACQIKAKKNAGEVSVATFATCDSGQAGRKIHKDQVLNCDEVDFEQSFNQVKYEYHQLNWGEATPLGVRDPVAQAYAGAGYNKVSEESVVGVGLFDEEQIKKSMAIRLRDYLSGNVLPTMQTPLYEAVDVAPGDLITVYSPDIFNNASNNRFRVLTKSYEFSDTAGPLTTFGLKLYKEAIFGDNYDNLEIDLSRGLTSINSPGKPPDVIPAALTRVDIVPNGTGGQLENIKCDFAWPAYDPTIATANGVAEEDPRYACELRWRYQDQSINTQQLGATVFYPDTSGIIQVDFNSGKTVEVFFAAVSPQAGTGKVGYIPDIKHSTSLSTNLGASDVSASVQDGSQLAGSTYVICENEIDTVLSIAGNTVNFANAMSARSPAFNTAAIAHPSGIQIARAVPSYPSLTIVLSNAKFTYPVVQSVIAHPRQEDVKVLWTDVSTENLEKYLVYVSTAADAGTNVAKLGAANPTWYQNGPESPPAGIILYVTGGQQSFTIPHEDIGNVYNINAFVRVAAKSGTRRYSSALSNLASSLATGTAAGAPTRAPTPPAANLIGQNQIVDLSNKTILINFGPIFADNSDHTKTFADAGDQWIDFQFYRTGGDASKPIKLNYTINDTSLTNITAQFAFTVGDDWTWIRNAGANGQGKDFSADVAVEFVAGNFSLDASLLTISASITHVNAHHSLAVLSVLQPSTGHPVLIKNVICRVSVPVSQGGDGLLANRFKVFVSDDISWDLLGQAQGHSFPIQHPVAAQGVTVQLVVTVHGNAQRLITLTLNVMGDATGDNSTANWIAGSGAATSAQAGMTVHSNQKVLKIRWAAPQHLTGSPDAIPASASQYGVQITDTTGAIWLNADAGPPYASSNSLYEHIVNDNSFIQSFNAAELPATFVNSGFKVAIRAYNYVNGQFVPGPWTTLSVLIPFGGDLALGDSTVPGQPTLSLSNVNEFAGLVTVTCVAPDNGTNSPLKWQAAIWLAFNSTTPSDADPPAPGAGASHFKFLGSSSGGVFQRAMPDSFSQGGSIPGFWTSVRCKNKQINTGGPGGAGYSPWSFPLLSNTTSSVVDASTDPNAPALATNDGSPPWARAAQGYSSVNNVFNGTPIPGDLEPVRIWYNGDNNTIVAELILPTNPGANPYTLRAVIFELYRANGGGALRLSRTDVPTPTAVIVFDPLGGIGAWRYRLLTQYRDSGSGDSSKGLSPWSNFVLIPGSGSTATYQPGSNPPPNTDYQALTLRPIGGYLL
jgi:hypothetical protein